MKIAVFETSSNQRWRHLLTSAFLFFSLTLNSFAASDENRVVAEIELEGNNKTKSKVIFNELTFREGDKITDDDIAVSRQNLINTELFSEVSIKEVLWHDGMSAKIIVEMREKISFIPLPIASRTSDGEVRLGIRYEEFNLAGKATYLKLRFYKKWENEMSTDLGFNMSAKLEGKNILHKQLKLYSEFKHERGIDKKYTGGVLTSEYGTHSDGYNIGTGWEFDSNLEAGLSFGISETAYHYRSGAMRPLRDNTLRSIGFFTSFTDLDNLGNYIYDGFKTSFSLSHADEDLGSDFNAYTFRASLSHFIPVSERKNIAYRISGGYLSGDDAEELLLNVGGSDSIRGYARGEFEGNKSLQLNSEYRFPITDVYWGGVVFADAGNAWPSGTPVDLDSLNWGAGIGLRLFIKKVVKGVGRLDVAYNMSEKTTKAYLGVHHTF